MVGFYSKRFTEFRRLKFEYQKKMDIPVLSDSKYIIECARIVNKSLEIMENQNANKENNN